ncbi:hypothetical protein [Paraburkholderia terrae]|uniref:hypothetical protein n=1 Tax=Paraburkholderia terrae TaxID=311230 RepID=UPI0020D0DBE7|nr:hypothetical protein [Paraburkholderia terrae]
MKKLSHSILPDDGARAAHLPRLAIEEEDGSRAHRAAIAERVFVSSRSHVDRAATNDMRHSGLLSTAIVRLAGHAGNDGYQ